MTCGTRSDTGQTIGLKCAGGKRLGMMGTGAVFVVLLGLPSVPGAQDATETVFWESVVCERAGEVEAYLETYPEGGYVTEAWACLEAGLGLDREERILVQQGLAALDYPSGVTDGLFGPTTRRAIEAWQTAKGFVATGYLTREQAAARADDAAYAAAEAQNSVEGYEEYLRDYPTGRHATEAQTARARLIQAEAAQR